MRARRRLGAVVCAFLLAAALTAGASTAAPLDAGMPALTLAQVLDIVRVEAPPPGVGLKMNVHFPDENPLVLDGTEIHALAVDITPSGGVLTRNATSGSSTSVVAGKCQDPMFLPLGVTWSAMDMPIKWVMNRRSVPYYLFDEATVHSVKRARRVWPDRISSCSDDDANRFAFSFEGLTRTRVGYDGDNTVDFGKLGSRALAVSYTWYRRSRIVEVDMRFNKHDYWWTNRTDRQGRFNVANVATHETGHQLGLDDLGDPHRRLTMFGRISKGETGKSRLGKGDIKGASRVSP